MQLPLKQKTSGSYPDGGTYVPVMALPSKHVVHNGEWESESPQECLESFVGHGYCVNRCHRHDGSRLSGLSDRVWR